MDSQSKEIERQFLEAIALNRNITGDTLVAFLARFSKENIDKTHVNLGESLNSRWNKKPLDSPQKIKDQLPKICEIFKKDGWTWEKPNTVGRPSEEDSEWRQLYIWLWEIRFPEWQQRQQQLVSSQEADSRNNQNDIDVLVQEVRSRLLPFITDTDNDIGTMRMLSVNQSIPVDKIYIDLNVLEQISCEVHFSGLRQNFDPRKPHDFDRFGLSRVQKREDVLSVVKTHRKLMVVGKPGSGKTTLLKSLAVECIKPEIDLFNNLVPLFVTLLDFTKKSQENLSWKLADYLVDLLAEKWGKCDRASAEKILSQGRALVLLDGLDEVVSPNDVEKVLDAIKEFGYRGNQLIITCRTQSQRQLGGFTDVEVADFTSQQVDQFVDNWFTVVESDSQTSLAQELKKQLRVKDNKYIAELTTTPVLLNLVCVVFRDEKGNLPKKRFTLYDKAMRVLLKSLNRQPRIELLTLAKKEEFLSDLAFSLFQKNDYLPEQLILEEFVEKYFGADRFAARELLETIETETGLLVERSIGYWSFSHLTFHEYFVAQKFIKFNGKATDSEIKQLIELHILNRNWDEVFLLIAEQKSNLIEEEKVNE